MKTPVSTKETRAEKAKQSLINQLERIRKEKEHEGVIINNVRYSGSQNNRVALNEALQHAEKATLTSFSRWKDSDGEFHLDHPVSDIEQALDAIALKRSSLINLEGQYKEDILDGKITSLDDLQWDV